MPAPLRPTRPRGFTLVELLVVIAIIGLISAAALPVVLPALNERRVSEAARILQAVLAGTRDAAIRANAPRGIRLLPDPIFNYAGSISGGPLAANRFVPIEPAPDYTEGIVQTTQSTLPGGGANPTNDSTGYHLRISEEPYTSGALNSPTGWKFNIRQGDKIRFNDSGAYYTVAGPINGLPTTAGSTDAIATMANPERFISYIPAQTSPVPNATLPGWIPEFLDLTNGIDDDGDGWIDESCDGIDNDGDGVIDPGYNGIDDNLDGQIDETAELFYSKIAGSNEFELEVFIGVQSSTNVIDANYTILRRPVVSPGAAETALPAGAVIDLTTWNAAVATPVSSSITLLPERSRLPVDPFSGYVDIMIDQSGRVVPPGAGSGGGGYYARSPVASIPFYHFWITDRADVHAPLWDPTAVTLPYVPTLNPNYTSTANPQSYLLPMPKDAFTPPPPLPPIQMPDGTQQKYSVTPVYLTHERRLVTLFTKSGQIVANSIESFNVHDTSAPYYDAQSGIKESQ